MLLQPIRVYCMHLVSAEFDEESMNKEDWMVIEEFKQRIHLLQQEGVAFISLADAYSHIRNDKVRCRKYAVLTFDDGYATLNEILPWLKERNIPVTLFINGKYLDGKSYRKNPKEKYLTKEELWTLISPLIEIGHHGWEHNKVTEMKNEEFAELVERNVSALENHQNYIPFWAYTYGNHTQASDEYLRGHRIVPVYIDGKKNYTNHDVIHRELLG